MQGYRHVVREFQGRVIFTLFEKNDRFAPYSYFFRQIFLRQGEAGTVFPDLCLHGGLPRYR